MTLMKRLVAMVSLVLAGMLAFAGTSFALDARSVAEGAALGKGPGPGGNGLPPAGTYQSSFVDASFFACCDPDGALQIQLFVERSTTVSNPVVGPTTSTDEVDVQFYISDYLTGTFADGCIIPDNASDFTTNSKFTSAQLNTLVQPTTRTCQGQTVNGAPPSFRLTATWTAAAAARIDTSLSRYSCGSYTSETQTTRRGGANVTATFSADFLPVQVPPIGGANLSGSSGSGHAQGTADPGCQELGGKGAGPGPQGPGDYTNTSISVSTFFQPDDTSQQSISIFATRFTNTAHPVGGPISTLAETDLNVFQFTFPEPIRDCWIIAPSDFSVASDLHTASLNVPVDETVGQCQFASNIGPAVQGISLTWNATSPMAVTKVTSQGGCGSFHVAGTTALSAVTAVTTGSWPGVAASITDNNSFVGTNASTTHVQGTFTGC